MQAPIVRPSIILTPSTPTPLGQFQPAVLYTASPSEKANTAVDEKPRRVQRFSDEDLLGPPLEDLIYLEREREARIASARTRRMVHMLTTVFALLVSATILASYLHPGFATGTSRLPSAEQDITTSTEPSSSIAAEVSASDGIYFLADGVPVSRSPSILELVKRVSSPFSAVGHLSKRSTLSEPHYASPLPLMRFAHSSATSSRHEASSLHAKSKRSLSEETLAEQAEALHARQMEEKMDLQRRVKVQDTKRVQEELMREAKGRLLRRRAARLAQRMAGQ